MAWISLIFLITGLSAQVLPQFLTKHSPDTLRYISMDGRYAYVKKKPGVLGLISSFRSVDFLTLSDESDFTVKASRFKQRLAIEAIANPYKEMSLLKNHRIFVTDYGNSVVREIGKGRNAKLHLKDEWITYFDLVTKIIHIENLVTQKKYSIKLGIKANPFFIPEIELVSARSLIYTDINNTGSSAIVGYDLVTQKSNIVYKSAQSATHIELCQSDEYLAMGEFPYDGVSRGSSIQYLKLSAIANLSSFTTLYSSSEQDIGNMVCLPESIYFVKTMNHDKELNFKVTEAVKLEIKTQNIEAKSNLKHVTQLLEMDKRVLIPMRGTFYVIEGRSNLSDDSLKAVPLKEELQIDI